MKPVIDADIVQTIDGTHDPDLCVSSSRFYHLSVPLNVRFFSLDTVDNYVLTAIAGTIAGVLVVL